MNEIVFAAKIPPLQADFMIFQGCNSSAMDPTQTL